MGRAAKFLFPAGLQNRNVCHVFSKTVIYNSVIDHDIDMLLLTIFRFRFASITVRYEVPLNQSDVGQGPESGRLMPDS